MTPPPIGVAIRTPAKFRLTAPVAAEDELGASVNSALAYLAPSDCIITAWDLSNARSAIEGGRKKRLGCLAGWPDMGVFWRGRLVLLELKRSRGGQLSPAQRALHPRLEAAGFPVAVVRSPCPKRSACGGCAQVMCPLRGRGWRRMIARPLRAQSDGAYAGLPGVQLWDEARDARTYAGPWPVVAHPPCQTWCKMAPVNQARYTASRSAATTAASRLRWRVCAALGRCAGASGLQPRMACQRPALASRGWWLAARQRWRLVLLRRAGALRTPRTQGVVAVCHRGYRVARSCGGALPGILGPGSARIGRVQSSTLWASRNSPSVRHRQPRPHSAICCCRSPRARSHGRWPHEPAARPCPDGLRLGAGVRRDLGGGGGIR